jgi:hypothetical protein
MRIIAIIGLKFYNVFDKIILDYCLAFELFGLIVIIVSIGVISFGV